MATVKAISPREVPVKQAELLPDEVIEAFNELIVETVSGGKAKFTQNAVVERILNKFHGGVGRPVVFDKGWLNVEPLYREQGWEVEYDKPGLHETYDAYFTFTAK